MPYLGNEPGAITDAFTDTFSGNGSNTGFTLTRASTTNSVFVRIHGVMQRNGTDFTVDGTTLTFTTAPPNASNNIVVQFFTVGSVQVVADNAITQAKMADNAIGLAELAGGTDGNLITFDASGDPAFVATGNDGQVLTSAGAGSPPTFATLSGLGKLVQIVNDQTGASTTNTTNMPVDDTIPQNNEGGEVLSVAITPSSSSNKLLIQVHVNLNSSSQQGVHAALFQDSTAGALAAQTSYVDGGHWANSMSFNHFMTSGTTSETTFKVRVGANSGSTTRINGTSGTRRDGGVGSTSITVTEISA